MRIGIVTFEYPGFTKNGGIGTAYGRLANHLASKGHEVSVYFVAIDDASEDSQKKIRDVLTKHNDIRNLELDVIWTPSSVWRANSWAAARSLSVFRRLRGEDFDVLHFHDCLGLGYYSQIAKKTGVAFTNTQIVIGMHGPNFWVNDAQGFFPADPHEYLQNRLERESIEMADVLVSPSQFLVDYLRDWEWDLKKPIVLPNVNNFSENTKSPSKSERISKRTIKRLVFFGRLEPRKGLFLFLDALERLVQRRDQWQTGIKRLPIVFMGKDTKLRDGTFSVPYIQSRFSRLSDHMDYIFHTDFTSEDCAEYFSEHDDALVCIPSLMDNSPYSIVEALEQNLNFITTDSGGQTELIHPDYHFDTVAEPTPESLAEKILYKMNHSYPLAKPASPVLTANKKWLELHRDLGQLAKKRGAPGKTSGKPKGKISLVVTCGRNSLNLNNTLLSIKQQTRAPDEVLILKWGTYPEIAELNYLKLRKTYVDKKWKFIESPQSTTIDAHKRALHESKSDYIWFLNDGDLLAPDAVESAVTAIQRNAPEVVLFGAMTGELESYPPPVEINYSVFFDSYGKFPAVIRKAFIEDSYFDLTRGVQWTTEGALMSNIEKRNIVVVPKIVLENSSRDTFQPYNLASQDDLRKRLSVLREHLPREYSRNLELSIGLLAKGRSL